MNNNLLHNVLKDISRNRIVSKTKDKSGNVDVNKSLSIARAKGYNSFIDQARIKKCAQVELKKK